MSCVAHRDGTHRDLHAPQAAIADLDAAVRSAAHGGAVRQALTMRGVAKAGVHDFEVTAR